jgi:hypothetical protein
MYALVLNDLMQMGVKETPSVFGREAVRQGRF